MNNVHMINNNYANSWLYKYIPRNKQELKQRPWWQWVSWAFLGNDDDGIFGEKATSGKTWTEKWGGRLVKEHKVILEFNSGKISFLRFLQWQIIRNPLHNFTSYVLGFKGAENVSILQLALITAKSLSFYKKLNTRHVFPMGESSGIYLGLHNKRPFMSMRFNWFSCLFKKYLEVYVGWRPNGGFGLALRFQDLSKLKQIK